MISAHAASPLGTSFAVVVPVALVAGVAGGYLKLAVAAAHRDPRGWNQWRTVSFLAGSALLATALIGISPFPEGDFRGHVTEHLLLAMVAPIGLVLGAPMTLLLRSGGPAQGRRIGRLMLSRPAVLVTNPGVALSLVGAGLVAMYLTPLYGIAESNALVHALVHAHFLLSGCLFAWVIAGPDPAPHRPSVPVRLIVLGAAIALHATVSQLIYAGLFTRVDAPLGQLQGGGSIMYYGGDLAELLLAFALVTTWRRTRVTSRFSARPTPHREVVLAEP